MTGAQHEHYSTGLLLAAAAGINHVWGTGEAVAFFAGGALSVYLFSPDLDLASSRAARRWGPFNHLLWGLYRLWHPHRGASHSYIYGPVSRLLFAAPLIVAAHWLLSSSDLDIPHWLAQSRFVLEAKESLSTLWTLALCGYLAGQWLHLIQDGISIRRLFR